MPRFENASDNGPNTALIELVHREGEGHEACTERLDEEDRNPDPKEDEDETRIVNQYCIRGGVHVVTRTSWWKKYQREGEH